MKKKLSRNGHRDNLTKAKPRVRMREHSREDKLKIACLNMEAEQASQQDENKGNET